MIGCKKGRILGFAAVMLLITPAFADKPEQFPEMRGCKASDMSGVGRLITLFEEPEGEEKADLQKYKHQYIYFADDGRSYVEHRSSYQYRKKEELEGALIEESAKAGFGQYVLDEGLGLLYFYRNGQYVGGVYCSRVTQERDTRQFPRGAWVFRGASGVDGEFVKVYYKPFGRLPNRSK